MSDASDSRIQFQDLFRIVRTRFWIIVTILVLTAGSGIYVTREVLQNVYGASAQIQIRARGETAIQGFSGNGSPNQAFDATAFQAEFLIMQSDEILLPIVRELKLDQIWAVRAFGPGAGPLTPQQALGVFRGMLVIDFKRGSNVIEVTVHSPIPTEAASLANAVVQRYKADRDLKEEQRTNKGVDALRDQIADQEKIVAERKARVDALRRELQPDLVNDTGMSRLEQTLEQRSHDLLSAREDADSRRVLYASVAKADDDEFVNLLSALGHEEANIANLRSQAFKLESDTDNLLKQGFEANHPRVLAQQAELDRIRQQIKDLVKATRRALQVDVEMADSRVALLRGEVDALTAKTRTDQGTRLAPYRDAQAEVVRQQNILDVFSIHLKELLADRPIMQSSVEIRNPASVPEGPESPNRTLNYTLSVIAGLFLGLTTAFLIEYLDNSVKTMEDAESFLGLPVLAVIPARGGPLALSEEAALAPHAEGYRILRAKLDLKLEENRAPTLAVISGGPGEGKSTTIYNLAVVCAQAGQSVILIDGDLRRPTLHQVVGLPNAHGLSDYLRGEGSPTDHIQATRLSRLHVITAGAVAVGGFEPERIRALLDDLKTRYDLVLIDAPPILGVSDSSVIARAVDRVILVVQHRRYPRDISLRAKRAIAEVKGNCVGLVLNSVAQRSDETYYYYGGYAPYRGREAKKSSASPKANGKHAASSSRATVPGDDRF